jgi:hypothetical protein
MPVRAIPGNRRSLTGILSEGEDIESVPFESSLERDFAVLALGDPLVMSLESQPMEIPYQDPAGKAHSYTPDFLVIHQPAQNVRETRRPLIVEVKYITDLKASWTEYEPKFRAALKYAHERGWGFILRTERHVRHARLTNLIFLRGFRTSDVLFEDQRIVLDALYTLGKTTPTELIASITPDRWRQAYHLHVVWSLVASGLIGADLDQPLTQSCCIWNLEPAMEQLVRKQ